MIFYTFYSQGMFSKYKQAFYIFGLNDANDTLCYQALVLDNLHFDEVDSCYGVLVQSGLLL